MVVQEYSKDRHWYTFYNIKEDPKYCPKCKYKDNKAICSFDCVKVKWQDGGECYPTFFGEELETMENTREIEDFYNSSTNVNHPSHYAAGRKYEPIEVISDWKLDFDLGNAVKYISRAGRKDPLKTREDLEKAIFYINDYITRYCSQD